MISFSSLGLGLSFDLSVLQFHSDKPRDESGCIHCAWLSVGPSSIWKLLTFGLEKFSSIVLLVIITCRCFVFVFFLELLFFWILTPLEWSSIYFSFLFFTHLTFCFPPPPPLPPTNRTPPPPRPGPFSQH